MNPKHSAQDSGVPGPTKEKVPSNITFEQSAGSHALATGCST